MAASFVFVPKELKRPRSRGREKVGPTVPSPELFDKR